MFNRNRNRGKSNGGEHNGFQNPTWAPSIRVHKKEWETEVQRKISEFAQSNDIRVVFPPMDSQQRKRVHELINRHGLLSHSEGRDPERYVVLLRKKRQSLPLSALSIDSTPVILSKDMHEKIYQLMMSYNITDHDVSHHLSVRTARKATRARIYNKDIKPMIVPPRSQASNAILDQRRKLPTFSYRNLIIEAICRNKVVLITGGTGCGKTTQIPQFLLEEAAESNKPLKIICTQPRRLPAIAVAERVSMERGEPLGSTVGYHIRLEQKTSASTVLTYCTSGVLLRMLTQDDVVKNLSHIILDEIHEREQNTDYLLIALKQAIVKERDLKIVLMSATMEGNLDMFKQYFGDVPVQHIDVPSRLYPVEKIHLGEILAMTGYTPPDSVFTSMSGLAQSHSLQSQSFPSMSHWTPDQGQSSFQQKDSFAVNYNVPPPVMQQSTQPSKYEQIAQQLAQSQAAPNQQSFRQPTYHEQPGYHQGTQQGGMTHAATWSGGMDQATKLFPSQPSMLHHPSPSHPSSNNPDVIEYPTTDKDASELEAAFPQLAIGQHVYNQQQPQYHPHQTNNMQYFQSPMDGSVGYSAEFASNSQSALNAMQQQQPLSRSFNELAQASSFGQSMREESERADNLRTILRQSYPQRQNERFFTPEGLDRMRQHLGPRTELLAEAYGGLGGSQYAECVDIDLIISTALFLMDSSVDGAILIFLPGFEEITSVREKLVESCRNTKIKPEIFTLHSQMNSSDQHRVFEHPGKGRRKVILSTNIAEASLTIDDVVFVIDTGKVKEKSYDHDSRISQLKIAWIAKSNAEQRSGRAGRCRVGFCFRLYSQKDFGLLAPTQKAEMQRAAIHEVCLHAKLFAPEKMSVKEFLSMAPEPPPTSAIDHSMEFLEQLGALYSEASTSDIDLAESYLPCLPQKEAELTDLGTLISKLPVEPQLARMLLFGLAFRCLQPTVTLVAALSHRDPFLIPHPDDRERCNRIRERFAQSDLSDHLALLRAINQFDSSRKQADFCRTNFISYPAMKMIIGIRKQLLSELRRANLIQDPSQALNDPEYNKYSGSWPMIQAAIAAGCYPGIGFTKAGSKLRKIKTSSDTKNAGLHPSSVIKRQILSMARKEQAQDGPVVEYLAYQELAQLDEGLTLKTVTVIPPVTAILIIGGLRMKQSAIKEFTLICEQESLEVEKALLEEDGGDKITPEFGCIPSLHVYVIEDWLACKGTHASLRALLRLRFKIMQYFHEFVAHPHLLHTQSPKYDDLLEVLANVLYDDHQKQGFKDVNSIDVYQQDSYHYRNFDRPNGMRKGNNFQQPQSLNQNLAQPVHPQQLPPQPTPVQPSGSQQHHPEPLQQFIRPLPPPPQVPLNQNMVPGGGAYNTEEARHVVLPSSSSTAKQPLRSDDVRDYQKRDTGGFNFHNTFSPFYFPTSNPPTPQAAQPLEDSPPPDPVMHSSNRQKDASQRSDYNRPRMMAKAEQSQNERKASSFGRINQDEDRDVRRNEVSRTYGKPSSTEYSDAGSSGRRRAGHRTTKVPFMKDYHNGGKYANGGDNETKQHLQYRSTANPSGEQDEQNGQQQERPGRFKKPVGRTHHNKSYVNSAFKRSCNANNNSNSSSVGHR